MREERQNYRPFLKMSGGEGKVQNIPGDEWRRGKTIQNISGDWWRRR